jgi:hypothetical protein
LTVGYLEAKPEEQAPCLVRVIYSGENCALWLKNLDYQWSIVSEGKEPTSIGTFLQIIPGLAPGRYTIAWYDPQTGNFFEKPTQAEVKADGTLSLAVPSFSKDLACLIKRQP